MDIATIAGIISAFGLVLAAIFMGGGLALFIDVPSIMIVGGGTLGATMVNYPLKEIFGVFKVVKNAFFTSNIASKELIKMFVDFAKKSRKEGILSIESEVKKMKGENNPIQGKDYQLLVDKKIQSAKANKALVDKLKF